MPMTKSERQRAAERREEREDEEVDQLLIEQIREAQRLGKINADYAAAMYAALGIPAPADSTGDAKAGQGALFAHVDLVTAEMSVAKRHPHRQNKPS